MSTVVKEMMTTKDVSIDWQSSIQQAATQMKQHDIGFLPVTQNGKIIGVVTDRDLVIRGYALGLNANEKIDTVATKEVIHCNPQTSVTEASKMMETHKIRRLLVMDQDTFVGVLTLADLARTESADHAASRALSEITAR
jgi:CBS domain-containing protein